VLACIEKSKICGTIFFRVCVLNRTSVYLHLIVYVIDQLRTMFFILAGLREKARVEVRVCQYEYALIIA